MSPSASACDRARLPVKGRLRNCVTQSTGLMPSTSPLNGRPNTPAMNRLLRYPSVLGSISDHWIIIMARTIEYSQTHFTPKRSANCVPESAAPTVVASVLITRMVAMGFWMLSRRPFQMLPTVCRPSVIFAMSASDRLMRQASMREHRNATAMVAATVIINSVTKAPFGLRQP